MGQMAPEVYLTKHGLRGFEKFMELKLEASQLADIHIGVTGEAGCGKSTFINTLRALKPTDAGAAGVNVMQMKPDGYPHPQNPKIIMWDLPAVDSPGFSQSEYKKKVDFDKYDFFLILSRGRFSENDLWLAKQIKNERKNFIFVHTFIDQDVANEMQDCPETSSIDVVEKIRLSCVQPLHPLQPLSSFSGSSTSVFLISCRLEHAGDWEYPDIKQNLIKIFPDIRREAYLLSSSKMARNIFKQMKETLMKRIWIAAMVSGATRFVPLSGGIIVAYFLIIAEEMLAYRRQLGLDKVSMKQFATIQSVPVDGSQRKMKRILQLSMALAAAGFILSNSATLITSVIKGNDVRLLHILLPDIGTTFSNAVGGILTVVSTRLILSSGLRKMKDVAINLVDAAIK